MKPLLSFVLLLIAAFSANGQKCHYTLDKKDEFNGEQINTIVYNKNGWTWVSSKKGQKYFIDMAFMSVESHKPMTPLDTMQVKLADRSILYLHPNAEIFPVAGAISTTSTSSSSANYYVRTSGSSRSTTTTTGITMFSPSFEVDRSVYEQLSKYPITTIRFTFAGKPWDFHFLQKPLSKAAPVIQNSAKCLLMLN